jgi:hypothetical protein
MRSLPFKRTTRNVLEIMKNYKMAYGFPSTHEELLEFCNDCKITSADHISAVDNEFL